MVGGGGLLGAALRSRADECFDASPMAWRDRDEVERTFAHDADRFREQARERPWSVVWAAGSATTATSAEQAAPELASLALLLDALVRNLPAGPGMVYLTSSAGGVYAGASDPPFDSRTPPVSLSPYGDLKLAQEALACERLAGVCPVVIGRLGNLYGPGQNLAKLQGLISRLALSAVTRQPINIFVPLDTIRDYVYVTDAAEAIIATTRSAVGGPAASSIHVVASGQPATVGQLIRTMNEIAKRRVPVGYGSHPSSSRQSADLRLVPTVPLAAVTPLPAGMKSVYLDILERTQHRSFSRALLGLS